ncbi:MAG TPA: GTPase HflX [Actinomycetota bacterium]|jgi:GTP-binding protein HflX|nr:GTPase HflX [Actinomycetota bacterium]
MSDDGRGRARGVHQASTLESPLAATWRPRVPEKAVLVGIGRGIDESDLDELAALADSAGATAVARVVQTRQEPNRATFIGKGKLEDVHRAVHGTGAQAVILDDELSPGQLRNLEERLKVKVIDRTALILDIFALHARSREGKAQVELAQLNYLLPRLRGWGESMSRLGAGIGTRGPGETKLEVDRQHIRRRISKLRKDLKDLTRTRDVKRSGRERSGVPQIAIAGYTNAGKSTLMNALTRSDVLVANQLFATLDPTVRRIELPSGRAATISDTVGFVSKLPHELVEAFRSTLEEVTRATLILHVADASSPDLPSQIDAVRTVLHEIGASRIREVVALNKVDLLSEHERARALSRVGGAAAVSALTGEGLDELMEVVEAALPRFPLEVTLLVPYGREEVTAMLYRDAEVVSELARDDGTVVRARVGERTLAAIQNLRIDTSPDDVERAADLV